MEPPNSNRSKYKFVKTNHSSAGAFRVDNRNHPQTGNNHSQTGVAIHSSGNSQLNEASVLPTNRYIKQPANPAIDSRYIRQSANSATNNRYIRQPVNPVPTNQYFRQQPQPSTHLTNQIKTSCDLDELLKRCSPTPSNSNTPPVQSKSTSTTSLNQSHIALNQASSSKTSFSSNTTISSQKNLYKLTNKPKTNPAQFVKSSATSTPHFSQYKTRNLTASSKTSTSSPYDLDPKKYKVNHLKRNKKISHKNVFKVVNKRQTLSPAKKKTSLEIHQLLAIRRSKFLRSQTKLKADKHPQASRIVQRYKLIKTSPVTDKKRSSFSSNYSSNRFQSNKYKLTNNNRVRSALVNKYVNYYSNLSSSNRSARHSVYNNKNFIANNLLYKSILTINKTKNALNDKKLINVTSAKQSSAKVSLSKEKQVNGYCIFFNRFGRCARGTRCDKIHDPKRISLCPRFLRGTCNQTNCLFSHTISAEKMPLCAYFAKGCCSRENCPYSHVYYGKEAKICLRFARDGFCPLGSNCKLAHINECEEFSSTGKCSTGDECPLIHRQRSQNRKSKTSGSRKVAVMERQKIAEFGDSFIGFHPSEIAPDKLDFDVAKCDGDEGNKVIAKDETKTIVVSTEVQTVQLKTRPNFGK